MNKTPIIAIDIDDVLADSTDVLRVFVNDKRGLELQRHHYQAKTGIYWGHYEKIWENHDVDGDGIIDEFHASYAENQSHVPSIEGSVDVLKSLHGKFKLIAISSRSADMQKATEKWITEVFHGQIDEVLCIGHGRYAKMSKGEACKRAGATYLIDDNIEHCNSAHRFGVIPILFGDYGWHNHHQKDDNFIHCKDWYEVAEYLHGETTR